MSNDGRRRDDERREVRRVFIDAEEVIIRADRVRIIGDEDRKDDRRSDRRDRRDRFWF
ncbi:uncharacterized protein YacL (UPF0231 family) [Neobacillus niacini]|uniref:hypothetical protein n=2 Tax=Neobacillus niacini TaxID=86668 RepID=UPI0010E3027A|nr:hypothetical protein [Neobacillus niacini]MDR7076912.1 uncharacterized protein YacL (UPF0231 family) [Neobacillus niacini]